MKRADIRKCFTEYVKKENLQNGKWVFYWISKKKKIQIKLWNFSLIEY